MTSGCSVPRGYKVCPLSAQSIKDKARTVRDKFFNLLPADAIDLVRILEHTLHQYKVTFEVREIHEMPDVEGWTNPDAALVILREDVYDALCDSTNPMHNRARFTAAHELGHLFLHEGVTFARGALPTHKHFEDSEWQADMFAAELLMPTEMCFGMSIEQIQTQFQVGYLAAKNKFNSLK